MAETPLQSLGPGKRHNRRSGFYYGQIGHYVLDRHSARILGYALQRPGPRYQLGSLLLR